MLGGTAALIGWIWLLVVAFQESPLWAIGLLLAPSLVGWVFAGTHLDRAAVPFALHFFGGVLVLITIWFGPGAGFIGLGDTGEDERLLFELDEEQLEELQEQLGDTGLQLLTVETGQ